MRRNGGTVQEYLSLKGTSRGDQGALPVLRMATIDAGAGSTGLAIADYSADGRGVLQAKHLLSAVAGTGANDVAGAIKIRHLKTPFQSHLQTLSEAGHLAARDWSLSGNSASCAMDELLGRAASNLLRRHGQEMVLPCDLPVVTTLRDLLDEDRDGHSLSAAEKTVARYLESCLQDEVPAPRTIRSVLDCPIHYHSADLSRTIVDCLARPLQDLCDMVRAMDSDICLLSGGLSYLHEVFDLVLSGSPVRIGNIVQLHRYHHRKRIAPASQAGGFDDTKTASVFGAMLQMLANGHLQDFQMRSLAEADGSGNDFDEMVQVSVSISSDGQFQAVQSSQVQTPNHNQDVQDPFYQLRCEPALLPGELVKLTEGDLTCRQDRQTGSDRGKASESYMAAKVSPYSNRSDDKENTNDHDDFPASSRGGGIFGKVISTNGLAAQASTSEIDCKTARDDDGERTGSSSGRLDVASAAGISAAKPVSSAIEVSPLRRSVRTRNGGQQTSEHD